MLEWMFSRLDADDPRTVPATLRAFQTILALIICTEYWTKAIPRWPALEVDEIAGLVLVTPLAGLVVHGRLRRAAFLGFVGLQGWYVWSTFPLTGNHRYLELIFVALFALLDDENDEERRVLLASLRWMVIVVLFYSGLQKVVHGYYFRGQFLAASLWRDGFGTALAPLLSAEELARLGTYARQIGDGPYLVSSPWFLLASNAVWFAELALAGLLFARSTRSFAWGAALALIVATEIVARELLFGVEFAVSILLFTRTGVVSRAVWPVAALMALLVLMRLGILPAVSFH